MVRGTERGHGFAAVALVVSEPEVRWSPNPGQEARVDFIDLRGIGECVCGAVPQLAWDFNAVSVAPGHESNLMMLDLAAHGGDGIAEGAVRLGVPCGGRGTQ